MKPASVITIIVSVLAVAIAAFVFGGGSDSGNGADSASKPSKAPAGSIDLKMAVSPEKAPLIKKAVDEFNSSDRQVAGKKVYVTLLGSGDPDAKGVEKYSINSGDAENMIARGKLQPDVWSPASSSWGKLLNLHADKAYAGDDSPSLVRTPLVIAMWEQQARALGYPKRQISFDKLTDLATATDGWASVGKPEFGQFKYVHTNPDSSTSGVSAVAASYFAVAGKKEGLTKADIAKASPQVRKLERSIVHYGDATGFIADELCKRGPAYASAVAMEEITLIEFNRRKDCRTSGNRLVALYPTEGSFFSDSPYIVLSAPWVTDVKQQAAAELLKFLEGALDADTVGRYGFRPADTKVKPAGLVSKDNGATPSQPKRTLKLPEATVLDQVLKTWRADRKPANVMLVLDNSGSMNDEDRIVHAREGLIGFTEQVAPQDRIGLTKFSTDVVKLLDPAPMRTGKQRLVESIKAIQPDADTSVYDATQFAVEEIKKTATSDTINAVVVLTDGEDTASSRSAEQVTQRLQQEGDAESNGVRVFTIGYGSEPNADVLKAFAAASGGKYYPASNSDIEQVYRSISSFF